MGITGLLPFLEKSSRKTNIKEFSGGTVAIDSYCWLHKGVFSCAEKVLMGQKTDAYVRYCMRYINMLLQYQIKPILVFDGRRLPAKEQTEIKRREARQVNRRKASELIQMGQVAEGKNLLKRAIDITHEIALELIKQCQNDNIDCIVAPYEADAQLAYLNISGIADVVITEDSDLTLFGCKKILFKMDFNGYGVLIEQNRLHLALNLQPEKFNMDNFRYICILSGCDYLSSLPGIGLGKAKKFITYNTDCDIYRALTRMGSVLNMKSLVVTQKYRDAFILADITFKHQLVFCPLQRKQVRLNPPTPDITEDQLQYAGKELDADLAFQLALGNCDPATLKMVHNFNPDKVERKRKRNEETGLSFIYTSIWSSRYELKTQNHITSSKKAENSIVARKKLSIQNTSPKDKHDASKLHSSSTARRSQFSEYQNLNENVLDMYTSPRDDKLVAGQREKSEANSGRENTSPDLLKRRNSFSKQVSGVASPGENLLLENTSPEMFRQKNPFVKHVTELITSPSILSDENCRRRGRNLMRMRRTIVDENTVVESKYFSKRDNEDHDSKNEGIEEDNLKNIRCNLISKMDIDVRDRENSPEISSIASHVENVNLKEETNCIPRNRDECPSDTCENTPETLQSNDDRSYVPDNIAATTNCIVETDDESLNYYENISSLRDNFSHWSGAAACQTPPRTTEVFRERTSVNSIRIRSAVKRKQVRQIKQSPTVSRQQSLLSMFGFEKKSTIKH